MTPSKNAVPQNSNASQAYKQGAKHCQSCGHALQLNGLFCSNDRCKPAIRSSEDVKYWLPTPLFHGRRWGNWRLDAEILSLQFLNRYGYEVYDFDLERMRSSSTMLDWIIQFREKGWATLKDRDDLLQALDDIFYPQGNLCSSGCDKRITNPTKFLKQRISESQRKAAEFI